MTPKTIVKFLSSSVVIQILNFILSFVAIKFLSTNNLGKFNIAKSISGSLLYANLGLRYALDRRLPKSKNEKLNRYSLKVTLIINAFISSLILLAFLTIYNFDKVYLIFGIGGFFVSSFTILRIYFRARSEFKLFINSSFVGGTIPILAQIIGVLIWKLNGIIYGYLFANILVFIIYQRKVKLDWFTVINKFLYIKKLFKAGVLMYLTNLFVFFASNYDKILIERYRGLDTVGEYSIVTLIYTMSLLIPGAILEILLPEYVKAKNNFKSILISHLKYLTPLVIFFLVLSFWLLPYIVKFIFVEYIYLIDSMRLSIFGIIPYLVISPIYGVFFANNKHRFILISNVSATTLFFAILWFGLENNFSFYQLVWLKISYAIVYSIIMLLFFTFWYYSKKIKKI